MAAFRDILEYEIPNAMDKSLRPITHSVKQCNFPMEEKWVFNNVVGFKALVMNKKI